MTSDLRPITLDALDAFAGRRRMLIGVRGLCVGIVALLGVMTLIAGIDALFIIQSQPLRWAITITGYVLVLITLWLYALRSLIRIPGPRDLARLMEQREPGLRHELLAAVELGDRQGDRRWDSPLFRALLQATVESKLSRVDVGSLLPSGLIRGAAIAATVMLTFCTALLLVPDLHFASRLTRALLPSAPVDRIASVKVRILAPQGANTLVPHNEAVEVVIELDGAEADRVMLESFREGDTTPLLQPMRPTAGDRRFTGVIQTGRDRMQYRILAGDAVTRLYAIDTAARPHPSQFAKTYTPPPYADLPAQQAVEKHGHLEGLAGTAVQLIIDTDQPVRSAELRIDEGDGVTKTIPLHESGDSQWRTVLQLSKPATYKVHLVSAQTGFDNALDPPFEIRTTPDQPPKLTVTSPQRDLLLPPAQPLPVTLTAQDDLGLSQIKRHFSINGGPWRDEAIFTQTAREHRIDQPWDLYELNLQQGDQLAVKFSAADRAGQFTESPPTVITIATTGFDPQRLAGLEARKRVLDALQLLGVAMERESASLGGLAEDYAQAGELQRRQLHATAGQSLAALAQEAERTWAVAVAAIPIKGNSTGAHAAHLIALQRALLHLRHEHLATALHAFHDTGDVTAQRLATVSARFRESHALTRRMLGAMATEVAGGELDALLHDLIVLREEQAQRRAPETPDQRAAWERLSRQQSLAFTQLKDVLTLARSTTLMQGAHAKAMGEIVADLDKSAAEIDRHLKREPSKIPLLDGSRRMSEAIDHAITQLLPLARTLDVQIERDAAALHDASFALHRLTTAASSAAPTLAGTGHALGLREDASPLHASDVALFRRALEATMQGGDDTAKPDRMHRLAAAMRTLEAGHAILEVQQQYRAQGEAERMMRSTAQAVTQGPAQWRSLKATLPRVSSLVSEASLPAPLPQLTGRLSAQAAATILDVEMTARRYKASVTQPRHASFAQLAAEIDAVQPALMTAMDAARRTLMDAIPRLDEQLAAVAREAADLEKEAREAAARAADQPLDEAKRSELERKQKDLDQRIAHLRESLSHDASSQDLLSDDGRARARDGDDAAAMLAEAAAKARQAMERALAKAPEADDAKRLSEAADHEKRLSDVARQLSEHYENLEKGQGEQTRSALRQAESDLGLKRAMDARHGPMEKLAQIAQLPAKEQKAALEAEAARNPAMQQELSEISREAVDQARNNLQQAGHEQSKLADRLQQAQETDQARRPDPLRKMERLTEEAKQLKDKIGSLPALAEKAQSKEAADAARAAGESLDKAGRVQPPEDAGDHRQAAGKARELAQSTGQAAEDLKAAQQQAEAKLDQLRKEESKATATLAVGNADEQQRQQAAQTLLNAKPRQEAAKKAAAAAKEAAREASDLADATKQLAQEMTRDADAGKDALAAAREAQPRIAQSVKKAQENVDRAARHESRIEHADTARQLEQAGQRLKTETDRAMERAKTAVNRTDEPKQAQSAVAEAAQSLKAQADAMNRMAQSKPTNSPASGAEGDKPGKAGDSAAQDAAGKWMARALDALDRAESGGDAKSPGAKPGTSSPSASPEASVAAGESANPSAGDSPAEQAARALQQAAQAQARAMAQSRQSAPTGSDSSDSPLASHPKNAQGAGSAQGDKGQSPGGDGDGSPSSANASQPGDPSRPGQGQSGNGNRGQASASDAPLPDLDPGGQGDWGRLPPRLARDLIEGRREEVAAEYRRQVEAYFKAIAQKARRDRN